MPEALTESFCERCGTRYEFAAPTQLNTMRKTRGLISGLKNYIMSQDALGDAVGDAMRTEEEALAAQQLEAFHESFNFCINCRQYTCLNCWNDDAGRCRTCVPIAGTDDLLEQFEHSFHAQHPEIAAAAAQADMEQADLNRRLGLETWPSEDLGRRGDQWRLAAWPAAELEPRRAGADGRGREPEPEPMVAEPSPSRSRWSPTPPGRSGDRRRGGGRLSAAARPPLGRRCGDRPRAGAGGADRRRGRAGAGGRRGPEPEPEPVVAEVAPEPEPEPVVAEVAPSPSRSRWSPDVEPEPEMPAPQPIRPISETILAMPQQAPPPQAPDADRVAAEADGASMAARKAQLDLLGIGDPGEGAVGPDRSNVLPYRSSGASVSAKEVAMRTASGLPAPAAFWEASAREVAGAMSHVGVQSCGECGLSLSASARFCRRCGTRQAQSA